MNKGNYQAKQRQRELADSFWWSGGRGAGCLQCRDQAKKKKEKTQGHEQQCGDGEVKMEEGMGRNGSGKHTIY